MIGGFNTLTESLNEVPNQIYNPATDNWSSGAIGHGGVVGSAVATVGVMAPQRIYVFSNDGADGEGTSQIYNPVNNSWADAASIPVANLVKFSAAIVNDKIYVIGGVIQTYLIPGFDVTINEVPSDAVSIH